MRYVWLIHGCAEEGNAVLEVYTVQKKGFVTGSKHFKCSAELRDRLFKIDPRGRHYLFKRLCNH